MYDNRFCKRFAQKLISVSTHHLVEKNALISQVGEVISSTKRKNQGRLKITGGETSNFRLTCS